jgi:hypothetical protein
MNKFSCAALAAMMLFAGSTSYAQTADGHTPAVETGCDSQSGAAFGLCNAYCEAMDCDSDLPQASDQACVGVLDTFHKITGAEIPPCGGLPQQGESCDVNDPTYQFNQGNGLIYGCTSDDTVMWCASGTATWACYNGIG